MKIMMLRVYGSKPPKKSTFEFNKGSSKCIKVGVNPTLHTETAP